MTTITADRPAAPTEHQAEPAATIVRLFGGAQAVARIVGRSRSQVYRWMTPAPHGTGGEIPPKPRKVLMEYAKTHRIRIPVGVWVGILPGKPGIKRSPPSSESA